MYSKLASLARVQKENLVLMVQEVRTLNTSLLALFDSSRTQVHGGGIRRAIGFPYSTSPIGAPLGEHENSHGRRGVQRNPGAH